MISEQTMDRPRPDIAQHRRRKRIASALIVTLGAALLILVSARLKPASPTMDGPIITDVVKRGEMLREVRGTGTLVPEEIRWVTGLSAGRIENIPLLPGVQVEADTVLVELSNPELAQAVFDAESQWTGAKIQLERLRAQLEGEQLAHRSALATLRSDFAHAKIEADTDDALFKAGLVPALSATRTRSRANELQERFTLEEERLQLTAKSMDAQLRVQESEVSRLHNQLELKRRQWEALKVRAGIAGVLQRLGGETPLQVGQHAALGSLIARVANPEKLKAEIRIPATQARDIQFDQRVLIDTRNGIITGRVRRIDPSVQSGTVAVDVKLDGPIPKGARPDLSVDGIITLERLEDLLHVLRPLNARTDGPVNVFKVIDNGQRAVRVPVKFGRSSIKTIEVTEGLNEGDRIILSSTERFDEHPEVNLQ